MEEPDNFVVNGYVLDEMIERQIDCNSMASEVEGGGLACKKWVSKKGYLARKKNQLQHKSQTYVVVSIQKNFRCTMDA